MRIRKFELTRLENFDIQSNQQLLESWISRGWGGGRRSKNHGPTLDIADLFMYKSKEMDHGSYL